MTSSRKTFSDNIRNIIESHGIDKVKMAEDLNVSYPSLIKWISGETFPRADILDQISHYLGSSPAELLSTESSNPSVRIAVYGSIPAGIPTEAIEDIEGFEDIPKFWTLGDKSYFALKVKGMSMYPRYLDGDTIIVLKQPDFENGQDCVVLVNGFDATLKRCYHQGEEILLKPLNPNYAPMSYNLKETPVEVLGIVKEIRRSV